MTARPVIVGAGPNGLVCAALLARAGLRPIVLEARERAGGAAATREIAPGFRVPAFAHTTALRPDLAAAFGLAARGVRVLHGAVAAAVHGPDGRLLAMPADVGRGADVLKAFSARDAERWPDFCATAMGIASVVGRLLDAVPPSIDGPAAGDLWTLARAGRDARRLGRRRFYELLRWGPMPIADLAAEWFETPGLAALLGSRGILGAHAGPRSAGTAAQWLIQTATEGHPLGLVRAPAGGPGVLGEAIAAAAIDAGAEVRAASPVARIEADERGVTGVTLRDGSRLEAQTVVSAVDPRQTFLALIDPVWLAPSFRQQLLHYRCRGTLAKVNLALSSLPHFAGLSDGPFAPEQVLSGRLIVGGSTDEIERAFDCVKYGRISDRPWLEVTMPSVLDAGLAPAGAHVMSVYVQWAPYELRDGTWDAQRGALETAVLNRLAEIAPDLPRLVVAAETMTPVDLERELGLSGGQIFHGEHALDQLYAMRPVLGWAQHRTPIAGLYLCGSGTHPGGGITGGPGAHAARVVLRDTRKSKT